MNKSSILVPSLLTFSCFLLVGASLADMTGEATLFSLAEKQFDSLSVTEQRVLEAVAKGEMASFPLDKTGDTSGKKVPGPDHIVRAELIQWLCRNKLAKSFITDKGICLDGVIIKGELNLQGAEIPFPLLFVESKFTETICLIFADIHSLVLSSSIVPSLIADGVSVASLVKLDQGFQANGEVSFIGAKIGGSFECSGGYFESEGSNQARNIHTVDSSGKMCLNIDPIMSMLWASDDALILEQMEIRGSLFLNGLTSSGMLRLSNTKITGNLDCSGSYFNSVNRLVISGGNLKVEGNLSISKAEITGEVNLKNAWIGGSLEGDQAKVTNENKQALGLDYAVIQGGVFFRNVFVRGETRLIGAKIGGNLECDQAYFINPKQIALGADSVRVGGSVFLRKNFFSSGRVLFSCSNIDGNFEFLDASLVFYPNANALVMEGMQVKGDMHFNRYIVIGVMNFYNVTVGRTLVLGRTKSIEKLRLILWCSKIGRLLDDPKSWPKKGNLDLQGLIYDDIQANPEVSVEERIAWLRLQPSLETFNSQPYEQLANVLRNQGKKIEALKILFAKENDQAKFILRKKQLLDALWHKLLGCLYRPWLLLFFLFGWIVLASFLLFFLKRKGWVTVELRQDQEGKRKDPSNQILNHNSFFYCIDLLIPSFGIGQSTNWQITARKEQKFELLAGKQVWPLFLRHDKWLALGIKTFTLVGRFILTLFVALYGLAMGLLV